MNNKRILIINSGWEQVDLIKKAKDLGLYIIATDAAKEAPGLAIADESFVIEPRDINSLYNLAVKKDIAAVTTDQCDYSYYAAAYVSERLGLPSSGLTAAQNTTNKKWMRQACANKNIKQPKFIPCKTYIEVQYAAKEIGYPLIIKPLDNRGNFGVNKVDCEKQLFSAFYEAISNAHSRECLVEEYIEGTMITVDGFAFPNGKHLSLGVASKKMLGGMKRVAMEICYPAQISEEILFQLQENHNKVVDALQIKQGCTHGEYMLTDKGEIFLIECANRGGGCFTSSRIVPAISNYDISELLIHIAIGENIPPVQNGIIMNGGVVLSFIKFEPGKIKSFENISDIEKDENVLAFRLGVKEGDIVSNITNDANRHAFVITKGDCAEKAVEKAEEIKKRLKVKYE